MSNCAIDHFMYAVPSLEYGNEWAQRTFGMLPAYGGEHVGLGTCNALLSLGSTYLEIIAPDPAQNLPPNSLGAQFSQLQEGGLVTWAVQGDLPSIAKTLHNFQFESRGPVRTERMTAQQERLVWELLFPGTSSYGVQMPFFIDWLQCAHPSGTNPVCGSLLSFHISTPEPDKLNEVLAQLGLDVVVMAGEPAIWAELQAETGVVTLHSSTATMAVRF